MSFENLDDYAFMMPMIEDIEKAQADALGEWVSDNFKPHSVIDIGCGPGIYLLPFIMRGIEGYGIDAEVTAGKCIGRRFERVDLRCDWTPPKIFDIGLCIEVAEHIPEDFSETLVRNITSCCNSVIFTAAKPGQGGSFHHTEREPEYWETLFNSYNFYTDDRELELLKELGENQAYRKIMFLIWNTRFFSRRE